MFTDAVLSERVGRRGFMPLANVFLREDIRVVHNGQD